MSLSQSSPDQNRGPAAEQQLDSLVLRPPSEAILRRTVEELHRMRQGQERDFGQFIQLLKDTPPTEMQRFAGIVDSFMQRMLNTPEETKVYPRVVYGLYNCIFHLEHCGLKERAELMYEQLLPLAERSGDIEIRAWLHSAAGLNCCSAQDEEQAKRHFSEALRLVEGTALATTPNALNAYEYFLTRAQMQESLQYGDREVIADLHKWCSRILGVVDHPANKGPAFACSRYALSALECVAETQLKLESLGESPEPGSIKSFERLAAHAGNSTEPLSFPQALFRLSAAHAARGSFEDSLSQSAAALCALENVQGKAADALRGQLAETIHKLSAIIAEETEGNDQFGCAEY